MKKTLLIPALLFFALWLGTPVATANPPERQHVHEGQPSNYTLIQVMQHLSASQQQIQHGLLLNNRLMIAQGAKAIAHHPSPKGGIAPYIKRNHAALEATIQVMDEQVHKSAVMLFKKSATAPMLELQALNHQMVIGCMTCHNAFRD